MFPKGTGVIQPAKPDRYNRTPQVEPAVTLIRTAEQRHAPDTVST